MPVTLTDAEYEALKNGSQPANESASDRLTRDLAAINDGDSVAIQEATERYNRAVSAEDLEEPDDSFDPEEFHADIEAVPDGDMNGMREVLAKHGRLPRMEG
ncbi:MAG: hypothetical protein GEU71_04655 [Actinobacteria bacterium]|nr:hypothetical protein [Actinomycetota bacterium]